ncbi:MAG: alpha-2-macroglobulin [Robiginitomaculum sp.]|nr:MAG: alpha-2-macroglobulin [Robiginitomaculum sp.]
MKRQSIFTCTILALFAFAGWIGYSVLGQWTPTREVRVSENNVAHDQMSSVTRTKTKTSNKSTSTNTSVLSSQFQYDGWKIDNGSQPPKACLNFTNDLNTDDGLSIIDYIRVTPKAKLTADISGKSVCLSGLKFGKTYELTMLSGLKDANANTLSDDKTIDISFGNRPPYVAFVGNGVILPRIGAQGLAIETVNITTLNVEIFRVGDRMIARRSPQEGTATPEGDYSYEYSDAATQIRESIWKGTLPVKSSPNTLVTTILPLNELVGTLKPGAYIINAERPHKSNEYRTTRAWRWIISTDLAMTTYQSATGLDISLRSIDTAKSVSKARIDLVARNNDVLATAISDKNGRVHFSREILQGKGVRSPRMLMAYGKTGDYAVLDFNRSPLDLSAFPIGGRTTRKDIDAYVFADRGVYRPGETANITAMLRSKLAIATADRTGHIRFTKPNGIEFSKTRFTDTDQGTLLHRFDIPKSSPRGVWRAIIEIDGMGQVGSTEFSVEDFVPQKLKVDVKIEDTPIRKTGVKVFNMSAQFLYGANGAGLEGESEARIRIDPKPFPKYKGYVFGKSDEKFQEIFMDLGRGVTDGEGLLEFGLDLKSENIKTSHPLRAEITVGASEPGGRYVKNSTRIPVRTNDIYIGIKPNFDNRVARNTPFSMNVMAVDWQGKALSLKGAEWVLVEEDWHYNWYRTRGSWRYRREYRDIERARGSFDIDEKNGAIFKHRLDWGNYRLIVTDAETSVQSSYQFPVGWSGSSTSDAPDQIQIGVPSGAMKAGQTVTLTVKAPYAGIGELVLANDRVQQIRTIKIPQGGSEIDVTLGKDMGAGVYAMLTVYTPRSLDKRPVPRRAVGIGYIPLDVDKQRLGVSIDTPKVVRPRQKQNINVKFDNLPKGEKVWLTLAAIDEGVLQVTKYKSPDPQNWYFGKKALSVDVRDDYARLLNPNLGMASIAKSGGDGLGGEGLTATPIKVVSLYSGLVVVKNNRAIIPVQLPDFNGELRLMAVAWSRTAIGSDSKPMKVRDPVPALLALPRFMAPGDRALATISLDNIDGKSGKYGVALSSVDMLSVKTDKQKLDLAKGERKTVRHEIIASETGVSEIVLNISGPRKYNVETISQLQTRSPFLPVTKTYTSKFVAGQSFAFDTSLIEGLDPGSVDVNISFSNAPNLDPSAYAASVSRYPYGCTEQTISAALPLLYAHDLGGVAGINRLKSREGVQKSIDRILNRQGHDGSFGLWSEGDGYASPWIGVYAGDFLQRAKEQGHVVNANALDKAYKSLKVITKMERYPNLSYRWTYYHDNTSSRKTRQAEAAAYAHYVLARAGKSDLSALRYFNDNHAQNMKTPLSWGHMASALYMMDDKKRATIAFETAVKRIGYENDSNYYQSQLRDAAGLMALVNEVDAKTFSSQVQQEFSDYLKSPSDLNTQEKAHTIMAIRSFLMRAEPLNISAKNTKIENSKGVSKAHFYGVDLVNSPSFTNNSDADTWRSIMVTGSPLQAPKPSAKGFMLSKSIFKMNGDRADIASIQKGDKLIVRVRFHSTFSRSRQAVLADLLPAGMEVEAILSPDDGEQQNGQTGAFEWLGELTAFQTQEIRDDRVIAVVETRRKDDYAIAYIVRAVTEGDFIWPGAVVEDMYRPSDRANTQSHRLIIHSGNEG